MHCARTRSVEISTYGYFYLQKAPPPPRRSRIKEKDGEQASTQLRNNTPAEHTSTLRNDTPAEHTSTIA